jgi:flagellar hook-length control protein FliK
LRREAERVAPADASAAQALPPGTVVNGVVASSPPVGVRAAEPAQAQLPASPGSPDFGPQLGAQITTFVRDGIEHAQLHLNPADMGPVSVQIQLDGQAAQVHLSADHPLTRQALEASMPQLASQLSEAGLTLSGGGVFEQPRQDRDAQPQPRQGRGEGERQRGERMPAPALAPARRGVVDLVA